MKALKLCLSLLLVVFVLCFVWSAPPSTAAMQDVQFNRDIRPIFSDRCFYCHGPDEKNRKAGLRLDTFEGATKDRGGYRAISPGKPDESELLKRVTSHEVGVMMPPASAKKAPITAQEAELLRRWIQQGAKYEGHWAFQPLAKIQPPAVKNAQWIRNDIDRFILARLEQAGLQPSPQADARTLIRRLSLDLIGLLPQPNEVEEFVKAFGRNQDKAYGELVERLLASPHYGERWGRHWLDQARYADSNGYTIDGERVMWPYRDWVIQALNEDKPFDQFTIEQLAGDLLPRPSDPLKAKAQLVATGFHRNTVINEEGGVDPEQARVEQVMDRVQTTGAVWLGLTVGCAQCHSHKFDPIPHKEYYQMFAFFNSTLDVNNQGPVVPVQRGEMFGKPETIAEPAAARGRQMPIGELKQGDWERQEIARLEKNPAVIAPNKPVEWVSFDPVKFDTEAAGKLQRLTDGSFLITSNASVNDAYRILVRIASPRVAAVRLRVLPHETLPKGGSGLGADGRFALSEFYIESEGGSHRFSDVFADSELIEFPARAASDNDRRTAWAITPNAQSHEAVFLFGQGKTFASRQIQFILRHDAVPSSGIGHFKLEVATETPHDARGAALLAALKLPLNARSPEQQTMVDAAFASARAIREQQAGNAVMAMVMRDTNVPRESFVFLRGDFTRPDKTAGLLQPNVFSAIAPALPATTQTRTRLDLAKWLVDPANPLTPRVTMNRIWMRYFGRGIVETEEDFGTQGAQPTHPELLDWLATQFVQGVGSRESGVGAKSATNHNTSARYGTRSGSDRVRTLPTHAWSLKAIHRLIVTSATYRQSSSLNPQSAIRNPQSEDPRNLLLSHQERLRVEAEIIRDAALSASGLLNPKIGGPSVRPPQADGVYAFTQNRKNWMTAAGNERFRRALYTQFYRSAPYPLFTTFDSPDFQQVCTRRFRSNTPLQSLTLANDPAFLEIAQGLAARLVREVPGEFAATLDARLRHAFALCFSRPPGSTELSALRGYVERQATAFANQPAAALANKELTKAGLTEAQAAALTAAARALFNTDNFITRE